MRKGKNIRIGIAVALLLLVVGFAAVSATLDITGSAIFKGNSNDFNSSIRFVPDSDTAKKATIESSLNKEGGNVEVLSEGKLLSFSTPVMDTVNETTTVSYYVENHGPYAAKLGTITCTPTANDESLLSYIEVTQSNNYLNKQLAAGTESNPVQTDEAATVTVKLKKAYPGDSAATVTINCTLNASAE